MNKIKIEKNIPIPRRNKKLPSDLLNKTLDSLEVGDSFVVTGNLVRAQVLNRMRSKDISFASRCIKKPIEHQDCTHQYRIWKISK